MGILVTTKDIHYAKLGRNADSILPKGTRLRFDYIGDEPVCFAVSNDRFGEWDIPGLYGDEYELTEDDI